MAAGKRIVKGSSAGQGSIPINYAYAKIGRAELKFFLDAEGNERQARKDALIKRQQTVEVAGAIVAECLEFMRGGDIVPGKFVEGKILAGMMERIRNLPQRLAHVANELLEFGRQFIDTAFGLFAAAGALRLVAS